MNRPLGPAVDATPRPLPARLKLSGRHVVLEPLHPRHAEDLWRAAQGAEASWSYATVRSLLRRLPRAVERRLVSESWIGQGRVRRDRVERAFGNVAAPLPIVYLQFAIDRRGRSGSR